MKDEINTFKEIKDELTKAITHFSSQRREEKMFDRWSLKEVVAHLNNWMVHDIDCLRALKDGREPYWEPDVNEFNRKGVESRKNRTWNELYKEFIDLGIELTNLYKTLPEDLWEKQIWKGKDQTAKNFLREDIEHWRDEHLIEVIHCGLVDEDWISPNAEIRQSGIGGKGLFAVKSIKKDDVVVVWGGTYVSSGDAEKAIQDGKLVMQWDDNNFSVEDRGEGVGYFVNHSCEPNLGMKGAYALVAMRDIEIGEELTADYAIWEADESYISKWDCNCGSRLCRKRITGKDWQIPEIQERYKDYFSPLINKRIRNATKKAYSSGGLVVKKGGNGFLLLLVKHEDGFLVFPKGHINNNETEEEAGLREVKEETGLVGLRVVKKLGVIIRPSKEDTGEMVEKTIHLFLMETDNYDHQVAEEDYGWFTYEEAVNGLGFAQEKQFLEDNWQKLRSNGQMCW